MPKFNISFAANVRAYSPTITIEAANEADAEAKAQAMLDRWPNGEEDFVFNPEYETLSDFEVIDVEQTDDGAEVDYPEPQ